MEDSDFIKAIHAANDAGFIVTTERRNAYPVRPRATAGNLYEVVIRRGLEVFWIGDSMDRAELQRLAANKITEYIRDYSNDAGVKIN